MLKIKDKEWNESLIGYIYTLEDGRTIQVQFEKQRDEGYGGYGKYYAQIYDENEYGLNLSDEEREEFQNLIRKDKGIIKAEEELERIDALLKEKEDERDVWTTGVLSEFSDFLSA
jgi:hypothetical protein